MLQARFELIATGLNSFPSVPTVAHSVGQLVDDADRGRAEVANDPPPRNGVDVNRLPARVEALPCAVRRAEPLLDVLR